MQAAKKQPNKRRERERERDLKFGWPLILARQPSFFIVSPCPDNV